eukprot:972947_1
MSSTPDLPKRVNMRAMLEASSDRLEFEDSYHARVWKSTIGHQSSKRIVCDGFWWMIAHFFKAKSSNCSISDCKSTMFDRMAENFVTLFLSVHPDDKDTIFENYYDGLAQTIFYSIQVQFTESKSLFDERFKHRILEITSLWTMGCAPPVLSCVHWSLSSKFHDRQAGSKLHSPIPSNRKTSRRNDLTVRPNSKHVSTRKTSTSPGIFPRSQVSSSGRRQGEQMMRSLEHPSSRAVVPRPSTTSGATHRSTKAEQSLQLILPRNRLRPSSAPVVAHSAPAGQLSGADLVRARGCELVPVRVRRKLAWLAHSQLIQHYLKKRRVGEAGNKNAMRVHVTTARKSKNANCAPLLALRDLTLRQETANHAAHTRLHSLRREYGEVETSTVAHVRARLREHRRACRRRAKRNRVFYAQALSDRILARRGKDYVVSDQDDDYGSREGWE